MNGIQPARKNKRVLVPMRAIFEAMGATINGVPQFLDVPPLAINNRTLAPLRFVAEAFGGQVIWDGNTQTASISSPDASTNGTEPPASQELGNTAGNIANSGWLCQHGDWVYFENPADHNYLYRARYDGSEKSLLIADQAMYINVLGDWIYYSNLGDMGKLYRIKNDGSSRAKLADDQVESCLGAGDWIYYANAGENYALFRIKTDGSSREKLTDEGITSINWIEGQIYFYSEAGGIFHMNADGSGRDKVGEGTSDNLIADGGWLYYVSNKAGTNWSLYRMRYDGSEEQHLNTLMIHSLNVCAGHLYFCSYDNGNYICRAESDGSNLAPLDKLEADYAGYPSVAGGYVYYWDNDTKIYRINPDNNLILEF